MSTRPSIEYDQFIALCGSDLIAYMEPRITNQSTQVSRGVLERMLSELSTYDEHHLAYALQLGADHSLETFVAHIPRYLAHDAASVWSTAFRILDQLPDEYVTRGLVESVRNLSLRCPTKEQVVDILKSLESRLRTEKGGQGEDKGT